MKIAVTGASGYIGNILTKNLLEENFNVTAIDNFKYDNRNIYQLARYENLSIVEGDVRDESIIKNILSHDLIIPLAALVGAPLCEKFPNDAVTINQTSIERLAKSKSSSQIIIYPTTNSGYGATDGRSMCDENSPIKPISLYGITKTEAEKAVLENQNTISLRLATVFGISPRMRLDLLVNNFVFKALNEGCLTLFESHFIRNYIHIEDVSRAFIHCIKNFSSMKNNVYNLGLSEANISKKDLALKIKEKIPSLAIVEEEFTKDKDQRNYIVSNEKIENTKYKPIHSLDKGITELIKGLKIFKSTTFGNI